MSSCFGRFLKLSLFGQSHGEAVGVTIDGFPAGMTIDGDAVSAMMARRAPGGKAWATARQEADRPEILSGVLNGRTTGQPLTAIIRSSGQHSEDYGEGPDLLRPGHADYTGHVRYDGFEDWRGGGHFSGRLTAPLVFAGALCLQYLASKGVRIGAHILSVGPAEDVSFLQRPEADPAALRRMPLPVLTPGLDTEIERVIAAAKADGDSVGGVVECMADGLPAGLGAPFFDSVESVLSALMFSIPAVKGVSFGEGFGFAALRGSEANDAFRIRDGQITTATNHSGGIQGGITNGRPVVFRCAFRPTPSIAKEQDTVSLRTMTEAKLAIRGRHDPCIVPRAVPVVEALCAAGLLDLWKERAACHA